MPSYNFQKQFVPMVRDGSKPHSIRAKRKYRPRVGQIAHLYYGLRTKQVELIGRSPITKVQDIVIKTKDFNGYVMLGQIEIDGVAISTAQSKRLAKKDGFKDLQAFCRFFNKSSQVKPRNGENVFNGDFTHWIPLKPRRLTGIG